MKRLDISLRAAPGMRRKRIWKTARATGLLVFGAWLLSGCAASHVRDSLPQDEVINPDSMLLAFSVTGNNLLRPHEILITVGAREGGGHQERLRIHEELGDAESKVHVFSVPRQPISLEAVVFLSASGQTHWITDGAGPVFEAGDSRGVYLGRLSIRAIRFLPYDDGPERRPVAVNIEFSDAGAEDFPQLSGWQAIGADAPLEQPVIGAWGREEFVGLRVMPNSRDEIYKDHRLENIFCLPKIRDFDEPCFE